jgi:hypothetical protein
MLDNDWQVLRVENNPILSDVPNTVTQDLMAFDDYELFSPTEKIDLIWCSPPCLEFSVAYNAPKSNAKREGIPYSPDLSLVKRCLDIIEWANPRYWVIENVHGAIKDFNPILGPPRQIIGPFALWGNFPFIHLDSDFSHRKYDNDVSAKNPLRANIRAIIPYPLADSLRRAIEEQRSILEWV